MKLKTAIYIIDLSYGLLVIPGFIGIIGCLTAWRGSYLATAIPIVIGLFVAAFLVKLNFINYYLRRCKYPFEFLSVLEQIGLTNDLQINWAGDFINGPDKTQLNTQEFLADNHLATDIGRKRCRTFSWINSKDRESELFPILSFQEKGLLIESIRYDWGAIIDWHHISSDTDAGVMEINYQDGAIVKKIPLSLEQININLIDLRLLLTHFKAKFG